MIFVNAPPPSNDKFQVFTESVVTNVLIYFKIIWDPPQKIIERTPLLNDVSVSIVKDVFDLLQKYCV